MRLIVRNKPDSSGYIAPPVHRRIDDYKRALGEFTRLTKQGVHCTLLTDEEYAKIYCLEPEQLKTR